MPFDVKSARLDLELTINQMAAACNIHRQTLVKWERNERKPDKAAIRLIETFLWLKSKNLLESFIKSFA